MHPIHLQFAQTSPQLCHDFSPKRLFYLLEQLSIEDRTELLDCAYLSFPLPEHSGPMAFENWYKDFKQHFEKVAGTYSQPECAVHGLVSFVLSRAYEKGLADRFSRLMSNKLDLVQTTRKEMEQSTTSRLRIGELDIEIDAKKTIEQNIDGVIDLHMEIELCKKLYDEFCEKVVAPLLEERDPMLTPMGPNPGRN